MAVVTFWNNNTGKIGQTHSAMAIATHMAVEHNQKILLMSTRYNDQVTMQAFGFNQMMSQTVSIVTKNKGGMDLESGIEGMAKLASANRLEPDMVPNYTRMILKKRLEILAGPTDREDEKIDYNRVYSSCRSIINIAKKYYDIVMVDLNNGMEDPITRQLLEISDIIMINLEQKPSEFMKWLELKEKDKLFTPMKTMLLINRYDRESKYNTKNVTRELSERKEVLAVPYNHIYAECVQEGVTAEFFLNPKLRKLKNVEERTAFFINELKRAEDAIIYRIQELRMRI